MCASKNTIAFLPETWAITNVMDSAAKCQGGSSCVQCAMLKYIWTGNCSPHKNIHKWVGSWFQNSDIQPHFSEARIYLNSICENLVHNTRRLPWNGLAILFSPRNILSFCQVTPAHGIHLSVCIFSPRVWCSRGRQTKYFTKGMEDSEQIFFSVKQPVSPTEFFLEISS